MGEATAPKSADQRNAGQLVSHANTHARTHAVRESRRDIRARSSDNSSTTTGTVGRGRGLADPSLDRSARGRAPKRHEENYTGTGSLPSVNIIERMCARVCVATAACLQDEDVDEHNPAELAVDDSQGVKIEPCVLVFAINGWRGGGQDRIGGQRLKG